MSMNRDNFRANQPPSKVLHIRNLPPDATEADIMQLCKPYGRVVRLRLNAGAIKHQAFVEFENVNVAMQMIYSFVGSADPPRVRQKTVYLQYSTRQEIGSFTPGGGGGGGGDHSGGSVIIIIMDNIHVALGPTLDTIHMLCAAFGEVAKITMFEKTGGLQALVQFHDPRHAREAQQLLDGSSIPDHLVPQHPGKISMKVSFSAHADLTIRSQSARSRDFTNPYLPCEGAVQPPQVTGMMGAAAAAGQAGMHPQQHYGGAAAGMDPSRSNVLLVFIDDVEYTPTLDALHTVFKTYGHVHKMTVFEKSGNWQALVQYADEGTAEQAKEYLDGHCMYPNHRNKLTCQFSTHRDLLIRNNTDRSWDYLRQPEGPTAAAAAAAAAAEQRSPAAAAAGPGGAWQQQHYHQGDLHDSPTKAAAGGDGGGRFSHEPIVVSGQDYERAHNEAARQAIDALGESLAGLPSRGHHPRTMTPQQWAPPAQQGYYGQPYGGYPPYYGYPAAGGYGGYPGYGY